MTATELMQAAWDAAERGDVPATEQLTREAHLKGASWRVCREARELSVRTAMDSCRKS